MQQNDRTLADGQAAQVSQLLESIDSSNDGFVDFGEFTAFMAMVPESRCLQLQSLLRSLLQL